MIKIKKIIEYYFQDNYVRLVKLKNSILSSSDNKIMSSKENSVSIDSYKNTFFGYYDKSPFHPENEDLLLLHANNADASRKPEGSVKTDLLMYNRASKDYSVIDSTFAWNWQQGARLHWLDSKKVIFNVFDDSDKSYKAKVIDTSNGSDEIYNFPVQESYNNEFYLSLDYKNLDNTRPDYGYRNHGRYQADYSQSSVTKIDLKSKECEQLFSVNDIARYLKIKLDPKKSRARINHLMINPAGKCFIYLFRYYVKYDLKHVLMVYDFESKSFRTLLNNQMVSHYCWINNENIIFWGKVNSVGDYYKLNIKTGKTDCINTGLPDGHPWMLSEDSFLTDTYPDKSRNRKLLTVELKSGKYTELQKSFESTKFIGETRCDLHPHPSPSGKYIHYDSIEMGVRSLSVYEVER